MKHHRKGRTWDLWIFNSDLFEYRPLGRKRRMRLRQEVEDEEDEGAQEGVWSGNEEVGFQCWGASQVVPDLDA